MRRGGTRNRRPSQLKGRKWPNSRVFLGVLGVALVFECGWYFTRQTNAVGTGARQVQM